MYRLYLLCVGMIFASVSVGLSFGAIVFADSAVLFNLYAACLFVSIIEIYLFKRRWNTIEVIIDEED